MDLLTTRIKLKRDTTANWDAATGFIPLEGEVIIYTDYKTFDGKNQAGVKIGDGNAYVQDLPFIDSDLRDAVFAHINNSGIHVTAAEKAFWNHKVDIDDSGELNGVLQDATLIFTRS